MTKLPKELILYYFLRGRRSLSKKEFQIYQNARKGYEGEKQFNDLLKRQLHNDHLQLNSLLLEHNGTSFQVDTILIFCNDLYLFEVKNYQGEFTLDQDYLHSYTSKKNYRNPLHQLQRTELILSELLSNMGVNFQIKPFLIFVNSEFTLFQAVQGQPIILPTQIRAFTERLNRIEGTISEQHRQFSEKLNRMHIEDSPYSHHPAYDFHSLKKGMRCKTCRRTMDISRYFFYCPGCHYRENKDSGVLRHVAEFSILFPKKNITTGLIHEWVGKQTSKVTIRNIMTQYMNQIKNNRYTYYTFK